MPGKKKTKNIKTTKKTKVKKSSALMTRKKWHNACAAKRFTRVHQDSYVEICKELDTHIHEMTTQALLMAQMDRKKMPSRNHAYFAIKVTPGAQPGFFT